jgi:hypothetical protein
MLGRLIRVEVSLAYEGNGHLRGNLQSILSFETSAADVLEIWLKVVNSATVLLSIVI